MQSEMRPLRLARAGKRRANGLSTAESRDGVRQLAAAGTRERRDGNRGRSFCGSCYY